MFFFLETGSTEKIDFLSKVMFSRFMMSLCNICSPTACVGRCLPELFEHKEKGGRRMEINDDRKTRRMKRERNAWKRENELKVWKCIGD
jgi:hypothetical protein